MTMVAAPCPKQMVHGPCGGVTPDLGCEVDARPCPFVDAVVTEAGVDVPHRARQVELGRFVIDLRLPTDDTVLAEVAAIYRDIGATVLVGEHVDDPDDAAPHHHAERLAALELPAVVTVTGRRRTPDEHQVEIDRLVDAGVRAVHCITGDHPAARFGPEATATFTLDGARLAGMARASGGFVSVAESPIAPPRDRRAARVAMKERAGADVVILNHAGSPGAVAAFADSCHGAGASLAVVAPVPVITDVSSARALSQFPGLALPDGLADRILAGDDPEAAGVATAVDLGAELLASGRFTTLNLSGSATAAGPVERARLMANVAERLAC